MVGQIQPMNFLRVGVQMSEYLCIEFICILEKLKIIEEDEDEELFCDLLTYWEELNAED